ERFDQALADEVREREWRGLRDIDRLIARIHGHQFRRMIVERRDRRVHLYAPVVSELLGDLAVDVSVGPNDEIELVHLGAWPVGPRVCRKPAPWKSADHS